MHDASQNRVVTDKVKCLCNKKFVQIKETFKRDQQNNGKNYMFINTQATIYFKNTTSKPRLSNVDSNTTKNLGVISLVLER